MAEINRHNRLKKHEYIAGQQECDHHKQCDPASVITEKFVHYASAIFICSLSGTRTPACSTTLPLYMIVIRAIGNPVQRKTLESDISIITKS
jgi:hypothetical protein